MTNPPTDGPNRESAGTNRSEGADGAQTSSAPAVDLTGITKRFGAVVACDDVHLRLQRGKIHGLLGENGAGKSTLMKVLIGLVLPDSGSISIDGKRQLIHDPLDAARHGIAMVHQHFSLVDALSVWENVALGDGGKLDPTAIRQRIGDIGDQFGLTIEPDATVGHLTAGLRQRVEIIKCLRRDPSIVVFDEPTSVLTPDESIQLFDSLRTVVAADKRAVVLVSHKLDEILSATDDITIMRHGKVVHQIPTSQADAPSLAQNMVGRWVSLRSERGALRTTANGDRAADDPALAAGQAAEGSLAQTIFPLSQNEAVAPERDLPDVADTPEASSDPVLAIENACAAGPSGPLLEGLSLQVHAGEIVGIAGVEGNGQRALADMLSSLVPLNDGSVSVDGAAVSSTRPGAMSNAGIAVIPEDRHDSGVVLNMSVAENLVLVDQSPVSRRGVIDRAAITKFAEQMIDEFDIQCAGPDAPLWSLSGGNQQRVVLARELAHHPKVLVAAQPTRGLDVGAIEYMTDRIRAVAASGVAVLLISSELEEILDVADRIVVMYRNRIVGEMTNSNVDIERLGLLMGGAAA